MSCSEAEPCGQRLLTPALSSSDEEREKIIQPPEYIHRFVILKVQRETVSLSLWEKGEG